MNRRFRTINISVDLHKKLKLAAIKSDKSIRNLVNEIIEKMLTSTGPISKDVTKDIPGIPAKPLAEMPLVNKRGELNMDNYV